MIKIIKEFFKILSGKKQVISTPEEIMKSKHFCMIPWIHTHVLPNSKVIPCCVSDYLDVFGDLKKSTLKDIWNGARYRTMRRLMIADRPVFSCNKCYELEKSEIQTMRTRMNREFSHHSKVLKETKNNGYLQDPKMRYFDIRFSNICNFKCRGCSPALSTKWYEDYQKLWNFESKEPKLINATKDSPTLWDEIVGYLPQVEVAYFAGGEPLLMDEHYQTLEKLIEIGNTNITLQYNTNLSVLKFKKYDLINIWKHFKAVELTVSLDDIESRGEYFRSGLDWDKLINNFKEVRKNFPHFHFQVNCTISLFNIHRIPEIHSALMDFGFIDSSGFNFNTLLDPPEYRTQVLTKRLKVQTTLKLKSYIDGLSKKYPNMDWSYFKGSLENQIHFMNSADLSQNIPDFKKMTLKLDQLRSENFSHVYPELSSLIE